MRQIVKPIKDAGILKKVQDSLLNGSKNVAKEITLFFKQVRLPY